jgi:hypothetical protein
MNGSTPREGADHDMVEAVVQVGARETPYVRCGRGVCWAILLAADATERMRLVRRFMRYGPVLGPLPPLDDPRWPGEAAAWLRGVIDGLGLDRPALVLAPSLAFLAGTLARDDAGVGDVLIAADDDARGDIVLAAAPAD